MGTKKQMSRIPKLVYIQRFTFTKKAMLVEWLSSLTDYSPSRGFEFDYINHAVTRSFAHLVLSALLG